MDFTKKCLSMLHISGVMKRDDLRERVRKYEDVKPVRLLSPTAVQLGVNSKATSPPNRRTVANFAAKFLGEVASRMKIGEN